LANPERTFETFRELTEKAPDIKLCVSTNVNCVGPDVGAKIYPWVFWNNKRIIYRLHANKFALHK